MNKTNSSSDLYNYLHRHLNIYIHLMFLNCSIFYPHLFASIFDCSFLFIILDVFTVCMCAYASLSPISFCKRVITSLSLCMVKNNFFLFAFSYLFFSSKSVYHRQRVLFTKQIAMKRAIE